MRTEEYLTACKAVDIPANQIMLEGAIYEVNVTNDLKLGLDFIAWKNGPGRNLFNVVLGYQKTSEEFSDATSVWSPVSQPAAPTAATGSHTSVRQKMFYVNFLLTAAFLDFLAAKGKARVVARPKIVARSNQVATFTTTDQILAFNIVPDEVTRTAISPQTADIGVDNRTLNHSLVGTSAATTTGLSLTVLPFIGLESTEVSITVEYRTVAGTAPQGTPIINTRTIVTRARVRDGEPLVLGGLKRSEKLDRFQGIPFLSRIKYLGLLFGGEEHSDHEADFVIVLIPKVVVAGESDMASVEDVKTQNLVLEKEPMEIPSSPWGFDQWLLDKES